MEIKTVMKPTSDCVLTINGGSSSIRFSVYQMDEEQTRLFYGKIESISTERATFSLYDSITKDSEKVNIGLINFDGGVHFLLDWLQKKGSFTTITAIGHRIVYGMKYTDPALITPKLLKELKELSDFAPEHLPGAIKLIEAFGKQYPALPQIACFDTAFHTSMPQVAKLLPIPRRYYKMGIQRYGFHGLSYAFLLEELDRVGGRETANGKIVFAHLGNGASLAAVKEGKCIDTSMGFTPTSGLPMSTRSGDLDPGVAWYLMQFEKCSAEQFNHIINHESGLLGLSETSSDIRELLQRQATDNRAAEAIEMFCYQTKKWIGSFAAALGGLDSLVFSGGIGENAPEIRDRICSGLQFLGIELDEKRNLNSELIISTDKSKVSVYIIQTNEELMIARLVFHVLNNSNNN